LTGVHLNVDSISCTTWRWSLSSAETRSCTLCRKYFIFYL